ncbi:hypothetical protein GCM10023185_25120 [Hymenobacter saemangeumensis]|uniref:DUF2314 domain-containing protein n=1 Tax=Hymenobacter saemangeumensis TaxID=1084522 RepID=A0ABP8IIA1_9BACT
MLRLFLYLTLCTLPGMPALAQPARPVVLTEPPGTEAGRRALATADAEIADAVREARRTLPQARKRFQAGLPAGAECQLLVRVVAGDTLFRPTPVRVIGWRDGKVQALLPLATASDKIPVSFPESAVLDWTILRSDGREEGNFVGRYLETARNLEGLRLR